MKTLKNKAGSVLLILALVFTSLCSSVTPVHADTQTSALTTLDGKNTGLNAIITYSVSTTPAKVTITLTRVQIRNNSGSAQDVGGLMGGFTVTFKDANNTETKLVENWSGTINNGATVTIWSGSKSTTINRTTSNTSHQIVYVSKFMSGTLNI